MLDVLTLNKHGHATSSNLFNKKDLEERFTQKQIKNLKSGKMVRVQVNGEVVRYKVETEK